MSEKNTILRSEFERKFAIFTLYAFFVLNIIFITTAFIRTAEQQNKRFKKGASLCDGYKTISKHQKARAKDIVILDEKGNTIWDYIPAYDLLAEFWKVVLKGRWGGDWFKEGKTKFNDIYHFEF